MATLGQRDVGVERVVELHDRLVGKLALLAVERLDGRAADDRHGVARELVLGQQLAHLELDQVEQLGVVDHVALVDEHHDVGHAHLAGQQDVLARLRHRPVDRRHDQDRAVHLRRARDHVLHVVGMARAIDVRIVPVLGRRIRRGSWRSSESWSGRGGPAIRRPSPPGRRRRISFVQPLSADTFVSAAVSVVLPWSTWPIVPTLQCGFVRSNFSLAIGLLSFLRRSILQARAVRFGARPNHGLK